MSKYLTNMLTTLNKDKEKGQGALSLNTAKSAYGQSMLNTLSSDIKKKQQKETLDMFPYTTQAANMKFQQTYSTLDNARKKYGANTDPYDDALRITDRYGDTVRKSFNLFSGDNKKDYLSIADNDYNGQMQETLWKYQYSVLSPEQQKQELEKLGYKSDKQVTQQNQQNVIDYAVKQGAAGDKLAALQPYIDAAGNMANVLNKARTSGWDALTEPEKDVSRQVLSQIEGMDAYAWDEMSGKQVFNALSSLTGDRFLNVEKIGQMTADKLKQDAGFTYEDADKALVNSTAYQFAKAHPGDLNGYADSLEGISNILKKVQAQGEQSLSDKEKGAYTYYLDSMKRDYGNGFEYAIANAGDAQNTEWGIKYANDLRSVNGILSSYQPTEQQQYLLGMYRNTLEGAKEYLEEAKGTKDEQQAKDNLWSVEKREKFNEYEQRPDFNADTPVNREHLNDPVYAAVSGVPSTSILGTLGQVIYQGTQDTALMTPEEKGKYRWYYDNVNPETAQEYYGYLSYELAERRKSLQEAGTRAAIQKDPGNAVALEAYSVLANQAAGLLGAGDLLGQKLAQAQGRLRAPINYNTKAQDLYNQVNTIRNETTKEMQQALINKGASDWLIDAATTVKNGLEGAADSVVGGYIGSFFGGSEKGAAFLTKMIVSSRSAQEAMQDIHNRKGSDEQAIVGGIAAGVAEWFFERYSIEQMFSDAKAFGKKKFTDFIKRELKEIGVNAQQEGFTSLANSIADYFIMGEKSEYAMNRDEYERLGMDDENKAKWRAIQDIGKKAAQEAIGGGVMGGIVGAGTSAYSSMNTRSSDKTTGSYIKPETTSTLKALAVELGGDAAETAKTYNPEKATNRETGELVRNVFNQLSGGHKKTLLNRLAVDLQEADISEGAALSVARMMAGQELGPEEIQALARDEKAMDVMYGAMGVKDEQAQEKKDEGKTPKMGTFNFGADNKLTATDTEADFEEMPTWKREAPARPTLNTAQMQDLEGVAVPARETEQQRREAPERPNLNTNTMEALESRGDGPSAANGAANAGTGTNGQEKKEAPKRPPLGQEMALFDNTPGGTVTAKEERREAPARPTLNTENQMEALDGVDVDQKEKEKQFWINKYKNKYPNAEGTFGRVNGYPSLDTDDYSITPITSDNSNILEGNALEGYAVKFKRKLSDSEIEKLNNQGVYNKNTGEWHSNKQTTLQDIGETQNTLKSILEQRTGEAQASQAQPHGRVMEITLDDNSGAAEARMEDGTKVALSDAGLTERQQTVAQEALGLPQRAQAAMAQALEETTDDSQVEKAAKGFRRIYQAVARGENPDLQKSLYADTLTEKQRHAAIDAGMQAFEETKEENDRLTKAAADAGGFRTMGDRTASDQAGLFFARVKDAIKDQKTKIQLKLLDRFAKSAKLQIRVYDTLDGNNASHEVGTNIVNVSLDADENALTKAVSHEGFHYIQAMSPEMAQKITKFVLDTLKTKTGFDLEARIADIQERYSKEGGQKLERDEAIEEIVADAMLDQIGTEEALRQLGLAENEEALNEAGETERTGMIKKITEWLKNTAAKLQNMLREISWNSPETRALMDDVDYISRISVMYETALKKAADNYQRAKQGLYEAAAQDADVQTYLNAVKNNLTGEDVQNERDNLAVNLFLRAEKGWIEQHADLYEDGLERFKQALRDYGTGKAALNKALRDQGLEDAPQDMNAALAYAGRQINEGTKRERDDTADDIKYSLRSKPEPKKVIYGYKAFYARDGKLYPPMVSNISDEQQKVSKATSGTMKGLPTPVGVWLDADVGGIMVDENGEPVRSKETGRIRVKNDKSGGDASLAFRPGWHLGEWPDAKQFNKDDPVTGEKRSRMPDDLVFAKVAISADVDYQLDAMSYGITEKGGFNRSQAGLPMIPVDGYYKYRTNVDPTTAPWLIAGSIKVMEILDDDDAARICAQYGVTPDQRYSGKKINLADYGLKRGPVTPDTDGMERFEKNDASRKNDALLEKALNDPRYQYAYVQREMDFDNPKQYAQLEKEFAMNGQNIEEYRDRYKQNGYVTKKTQLQTGVKIKSSLKAPARDAAYMEAIDSGDEETAQKMVDEAAKEAGYNIHAYHGTARGDRVGNVFRPERATSGPMAYFTSDEEIAGNYARDKADTSIDYEEEYDGYYNQFRVRGKDGSTKPVQDLWNGLSFAQKQKITNAAKHITWDEDMENVVYDQNAQRGNGSFDNYMMREHNGNAIEALIDSWLESGELYDQESTFLEVLKLAGIDNVEYFNPDERHEKVYDVYLKINSPFDTSVRYTADFVNGLENWWKNQDQSKYRKESANADMWDKNNTKVEQWIEKARDDLANGRTHAWTTIPDAVTDYLKSQGYDGIIDQGGKMGGPGHTVYIPFTGEQVKETAAVEYDNAGNVIPLSERFDTGKNDIRYSMKQSRKADTDQRQENAALESVKDDPELYAEVKNDPDSLAALMMLRQLHSLTTAGGEDALIKKGAFESRLSEIADGIIEKTGTKYGKRKLMAALRKVYTAMEESQYNVGELLQYTRGVMWDLLEASPGVLVEQDETTKEIIKELKNSRFYLTDDQKSEIQNAYGTISNYTRKNFGKMHIVKRDAKTSSLAEFWRETLTPLNPATFAEDTNELDMPGILDAWLEHANEKKFDGEYGANIGRNSTDLALNAMLDFYDVPGALKTKSEIREEFREKYGQQQERIRQLTDTARNAVNTAREEYAQRYRERVEKAQERREETERKQGLRKKITRDVKAINSLNVKQNDLNHVPEEMRAAALEAVRPFLAGSGVFTNGEMIRLANTYSILQSRAGEIGGFDEDILETINGLSDRLNGRRLSELTEQELSDLSDIMGNIRKMIADANEAFVAGRKTTIDALSGQLKEDMRKKKQAKQGKLASAVRGLVMKESTPTYFADRVGGVLQDMIGDFYGGQNTWAFTMDKAKKYLKDQIKKYNVQEWIDDDKHARFVTTHGDQIELNREEALALYALWKRETGNKLQNANHLRVGGFMYKKGTQYEGVDTLRPHPLTSADMHMIDSYLTDEQKAFADEMVRYLSEDMSRIGNEVSMRLYGYEKFKEPYYFPYETDHRYLVGDLTQNGEQVKQPKSAGMTKALMQNAATPITVGGFIDTWANHINQMALYAGFAESVDTMSRVLNQRTAGEVVTDSQTGEEYVISPESNWIELERAIGAEGVKYLKTLVRDISGGVRADERSGVGKALSLFKKGSVAGNLSVVVQQPTAYARALLMVSPRYLVEGNPLKVPQDIAKLPQNIRNMYKYSGVALIKNMGRFDTGTGKGAISWLTEDAHKGTLGERVVEGIDKWTGIGAEKADEWTWGILWGAIENETKHNRADLTVGTDEFYQAVAERFEDVVNHTQVYDSVLSKSEWMRSGTLMDKMVTSFMAEPTLSLNMLMDAIGSQVQEGKGQRIARAAGAFTLTALLNALAKSLVTATRRKKDEGRTWLEKYVAEAAGNFLDDMNPFGLVSMIPWARDAVSIFEGYDVERSDMDAIQQVKKAYDTLDKYLSGGNITLEDTIQGTLGPIANLFGIPLKNVWRDTEAIIRNLWGGASASEPTTARDLKYSVLENLNMGPISLYDSGNKAYYDRMEQALLAGDAARYDELRGYLEETKQVKPDTITSGVKSEIKGSVTAGLISDDRAIGILEGTFGMDREKAWSTVEKWTQEAAHAEDEDYNYSTYRAILDMAKDGQDITAEAKKLTDNAGVTDKDIRSKIKSGIGEWYTGGEISREQTVQKLKTYAKVTDANDLYWIMDEWDYKKANPKGEYKKYNAYYKAIETGTNLQKETKRYLDNGVKKDTLASQITSNFKQKYLDLIVKGKLNEATALKARLLNAYEALGYDRNKKQKDIDKWTK